MTIAGARVEGSITSSIHADLRELDAYIYESIAAELSAEQERLCLIASRNYASRAVMEALGSVMVNTASEGYPGKRFHAGTEQIDVLEKIAIDRANRVRPHLAAAYFVDCANSTRRLRCL